MKKLITFILFATVAASCFGQSKKQSAISPDAGMVSLMNEAKSLMKYRGEIALPAIEPPTDVGDTVTVATALFADAHAPLVITAL